MQGKLSILILTGLMAAGTTAASTFAEWRLEEDPTPTPRRPQRSGLRKSDRQIAAHIFHAPHIEQSSTLYQPAKQPARQR